MNWDWEKLQNRQKKSPPSPPGFDEITEKLRKFREFKFPFWKVGILVLGLLWLASGIYIVAPEEMGVVKRFGAFDRITGPGPHYHIPYPIESVATPDVARVRRVEIGFRSLGQGNDFEQGQIRPVEEESLMLTGDENILDVQFIVQFQVADPVAYLFNVVEPEATVKVAAQSALREVIGKSQIDDALTTGKQAIQQETRGLIQDILDSYKAGIQVVAVQMQNVHPPYEVIDSFKDVASAREDRDKFINQAKAYRNDILPRAEGQAAIITNAAQAYGQTKVLGAEGDAARFTSVLTEYRKARDITAKRLYLETMEEILSDPSVQKIILSDEALKQAVPYLPLEQLGRGAGQNPAGQKPADKQP
ncbi:MAG: FtsH protease activity modulator HflK [Desulfovibrionaceae bacterium]